MNEPGDATAIYTQRDVSVLREHALRVLSENLQAVKTQHPLDIPRIFDFERPNLGGMVPLQLYRTIRLLAFREVLGSKIAASLLQFTGRSVAQKMKVDSMTSLVKTLGDMLIGKVEIESHNDDGAVINIAECATCSGMPSIGEPLCHFESGLIAGALESVMERPVSISETRCWGLGDRVCRWEVNGAEYVSVSRPLELDDIMLLASKASLAMENGIAVRQKNLELRTAYHKLRESERLKKDLTDMVVHDMRVPLTTIMGSLESLAELSSAKLSPKETRLLDMATSSSQTLVQMINDLLDIRKLEEHTAHFRKSSTSVESILDEAIKQISVIAKRKNIKVQVQSAPDLPRLHVDVNRIARVLVNLLSNAVRHTSAQGEIVVSTNHDVDEKAVSISVTDNGEGIPPEYHSKIFDKFIQIASPISRRQSSMGLGLTFCKLVVESHGGTIRVESEPGAGSKFIFTLPVK